MKDYIAVSGSIFPIMSLILFVTIFVIVIIFIATDRREAHQERMRSMALDDAEGSHRG